MKRLLLLAAVVAVLALALALPAFASHAEPGVDEPCEVAHECFSDVAKWYPPGWPEDRISLVAWNPQSGGYEAIAGYGLAALCYNYGGYYYLDYGGAYWNSC